MKLPRRNISAACYPSVGVTDEVQLWIKIAVLLLDSELPCVICYSGPRGYSLMFRDRRRSLCRRPHLGCGDVKSFSWSVSQLANKAVRTPNIQIEPAWRSCESVLTSCSQTSSSKLTLMVLFRTDRNINAGSRASISSNDGLRPRCKFSHSC